MSQSSRIPETLKNSTFLYYCEQDVTPNEYFFASLSVTGVSLVLLIALLVFVAVEGMKAKMFLQRQQRTWITALDMIGGIGGVDALFESYEEVLGKNKEDLEKLRKENVENRRYSTPYLLQLSEEERKIHQSISQRSKSNLERIRMDRSEEEEADFYLRVLNYPQLLYETQNSPTPKDRSDSVVSVIRRKFSLSSISGSGSGENVSVATSPIPVRTARFSSIDEGGNRRSPVRTSRVSSLDEGVSKRIFIQNRKKPSVIHESFEFEITS